MSSPLKQHVLQSHVFSPSETLAEPKSLLQGTIDAFGAVGDGGRNPDVETIANIVGGMAGVNARRKEYCQDVQGKLRCNVDCLMTNNLEY
jgi:hypothetical protein